MSSGASIQALPPTTVHRIGSSQVLVDPACAVKELLDNALDARATSVSIEISTNTLDVIHVRDNGHGIAPDDRVLICKRYCTSKIRDFADLRNLGGTSLGFRGEALSSLAELSASLSVTTRVEGESTALKMTMNSKGEVTGYNSVHEVLGSEH
jgi:DNA mismatch repair protein MutL